MFAGFRDRAIVLVILVASAVSACSSDDVILRSEYTAEVNRLCSATTAQIDAALIPVIETYIGGLDMASSDEEALTDQQIMDAKAQVGAVVTVSFILFVKGKIDDVDRLNFVVNFTVGDLQVTHF